MNERLITLAAAAGLIGAGPVLADHNSKNGEGWANMPNDIHNTRVETRENDDNAAFRDFVKYGEGSKTVNRFDSEGTQPGTAVEQKSSVKNQINQGAAAPMSRNEIRKRVATNEQVAARTHSRLDRGTSATSRLNRSRSSTSAAGNRNGRGRR